MLLAYSNSNRPNPLNLTGTIAPARQKVEPKTSEGKPTSAPADKFSKDEKEALVEWNERLRPDLGLNQTPPAGEKQQDFSFAQGYVADIIDQLAGPELTKQGVELHVEVFSGNIPQLALDDDNSLEEQWNQDHPNQEWPVRGWLGVPSGSEKPIYRLAINAGMLKALDTRDELAFVLAQQTETLLDHDKNDPNNEALLSPANQSYVNPGEMQGAADQAAIARMAKSGFNPRGALSAISKLYKQNPIDYPADDLQRGLIGAAHNHEHQGMRVGLVQAEVESYVRREDPSVSIKPVALPPEIDIDVKAKYEKEVSNTERFQRDYRNLADKLSTDKTPDWFFGKGVPPKEIVAIRLAGGSSEDKEEALSEAAKHLSQSDKHTPQQKVDGFLRLLLALEFEGESISDEKSFSEQTIETIGSFLANNSANWEGSKFFASLDRPSESLQQFFVRQVVFNENFQTVAAPALPTLAESIPQAWTTDEDNKPGQFEELTELIKLNHKGENNSWAMGQSIDAATLKFVNNLDAQALAIEPGRAGAPRAMVLSNDLLGLKQPSVDFQVRLQQAAEPLLEATDKVREDAARVKLRPPFADPKNLNAYLIELGESEIWKSFSPEFQQDLPLLLKDVASISSKQPDFVSAEGQPGQMPNGMEQRLVALLKDSPAEKKKSVLDHISRHLVHAQKVKGRSPRRAWLKEAAEIQSGLDTPTLVSSFAKPDLSQHSNLISKTLTEGYNLQPEDLPDTSTASLEALKKRIDNEEFKPKRENYATDEQYDKALEQFSAKTEDMGEVMSSVAPLESRLVLGRMALLGHDQTISQEVAAKFSIEDFKQVLAGGEEAVKRSELLTEMGGDSETEHVGSDAGAFVMDGFLAVQEQVKGLDTWHDLATRTMDFSKGGTEARVGTKRALGNNLFTRLEKLEQAPLREWMSKEKVLDLLSSAQASDLLVQCLGQDCKPGASTEKLASLVKELDETYELTDKYPVAYVGMRDKVAEIAKLQPRNVEEVFPKIERGVTDTTAAYAKQARALSGLLAVARERSALEQIDTIEYLMGRQEVMPAYLESAADGQKFAPLTEAIQTTRQDLLDADSQTRVMVANSFLAGPSGILRSDSGKKAVINHFLKNLEPKNRKLGEKIARGVLYSHGQADTLAVAFILGQKPEEPKEGQDPGQSGKLDEAKILNRLFDAYGVPGIKMKQYLAFTSEFSDFKDAFESAQDAAMPLNYYQVLKLVQERFGDEWPSDLQIDRVLGSGSVNVAIRYRNEETGKREVVSLGREDIEESTRYDFDRFNKFIEELTKTPEDRETFGYVLGLLNLIEHSVELEFEKDQAMAVQKTAYKTYKHKINGWTIKSIDAYRVENLGLFMEEAKGRTARKIFVESRETYDSAMQAMSKAEFGVLKGQGAKKNWRPKPLFANPDFHDGQVLIDKENSTVTILDFGQAVHITNDERKQGLDLLTIIGKGDSPKAAAKRINKRYFGKEKIFTAEELEPVMARKDRMDIFIHLLSALSRKGADVPLSSVNWILGINRQMALGEKIGKPIDKEIRNMVIAHKIGLPLTAYNTAHETKEAAVWMGKVAAKTAVHVATSIAHVVGGWFGWEPSEAQQQQSVGPVEKRKRTEATYKAWRPNFKT